MSEEQLLEMSGSVEDVVFRNDKNGYTILEMNNGQELVTVVGSLPWVSVGEILRVVGRWTKHPTFGVQFKAEAFERYKPETASAMLKYLSSGAVKGIGPSTAAKIVEAFGENTLRILEEEPERLSIIKGITKENGGRIPPGSWSAGCYGSALRLWSYSGGGAADLACDRSRLP